MDHVDLEQRLVVRLRRTKRNPATHDCADRFLNTDRQKALLDLQEQLGDVRLETGRDRNRDARSALVYHAGGRADNEAIDENVRAMVACAEVLTKGH